MADMRRELRRKYDHALDTIIFLLRQEMKYATEQRLRMIDFLLYQYGYVNRSSIIDCFGIGSAQATRDFSEYQRLAPKNMCYNKTEKAYYKTQLFERVWA